ncbi:hypothetical protein C7431_1103 [Pantoea allii]|uniref:Uncharacterized protein n=1 Tax=Pantoea allii TaxID=574096 RepID=A0A2V2BD92_9GAMM|nr:MULTISPECIES: hypothetical protein [Pantoea]PWK94509.1 hypothetical protein C7431_1103 [Pantoea allii]
MLNILNPDNHAMTTAAAMTFADLSCLAEQVTDHLPFDADNAIRAGAAAAALTTFARYTGLNTDGESAETVIVDFLTDLMHLCSETGMPLCEMLLSASRQWLVEQDA